MIDLYDCNQYLEPNRHVLAITSRAHRVKPSATALTYLVIRGRWRTGEFSHRNRAPAAFWSQHHAVGAPGLTRARICRKMRERWYCIRARDPNEHSFHD